MHLEETPPGREGKSDCTSFLRNFTVKNKSLYLGYEMQLEILKLSCINILSCF